MQLALKTMEESFPDSVSWTRPTGGYTIWIKIPKRLSEEQAHELTSSNGVVISPGHYYFPKKKTSEYFRVSIAKTNEDEMTDKIKTSWPIIRNQHSSRH